MMYKTLHIDRKILSLFVVCGSVFVTSSYAVYASNSGTQSPALKVYIPNLPSFVSHFKTDKMEYNTGELILSAKGNVEIHHDNVVLKADAIEYNQMENKLLALGNVKILEPNGKVLSFAKVELRNKIKDAIVGKFKAQMVDNDVFMAAEERKPSGHYANYAAGNSKKSLFDKMFTYLNSDFLTASNAESNAERLANLAPAAGDNMATLDNRPVIGNVPLIALPEEKSSPATETASTVALDTPSPVNSAELSKTTEEVKPQAQAETTPALTTITPLVSPPKETEEKKNVEEKVIENIATKDTVEEAKKEPEKIEKETEDKPTEKAEEASSEKKVDKSEVKESESKNPSKEKEMANEKLAKKESSSEPEEALSPKSRELLDKIVLPTKPKKGEAVSPLKVEHSRNMQDLFKGSAPSADASQADALGVKVDKKKSAPVSVDYELEKAYNATVSGQNEAAMAAYQSILDNSPGNPQALFGLATLYHRARQLDKARSLYARLLAADPYHRDGFNNFLVLLADEAPREALIELEKLEEKNPGFSTIPAQIAVVYQKLGNSDKAIDKMFRAVALAPENLTYRYNLAIMLDKQKNYDEAAKLYKQLIEASNRGEKIPGNIDNIQQRLTFISSNRR